MLLISRSRVDFTQTRVLDRETYLGHADPALSFFRCPCTTARLWRTKRKFWMRLIPFARLYWCEKCGLRILRGKASRQGRYSSWGWKVLGQRRS